MIINEPFPQCFGSGSGGVEWIHSSDIVSVRPPNIGDCVKQGRRRRSWPVFLIIAFPRQDKAGRRQKKSFFFQVNQRRDEAVMISQVWVAAVLEVCLGVNTLHHHHLSSAPHHHHHHLSSSSAPLLVLVNPASGKGESVKRWREASLVLSEAGRGHEMLITEGPGHAAQIMSSLELDSWSGVVTVSGDGLLHEVYQGLLSRDHDWRSALQFSVGVVPGGSGNALVNSLLHQQGKNHS